MDELTNFDDFLEDIEIGYDRQGRIHEPYGSDAALTLQDTHHMALQEQQREDIEMICTEAINKLAHNDCGSPLEAAAKSATQIPCSRGPATYKLDVIMSATEIIKSYNEDENND